MYTHNLVYINFRFNGDESTVYTTGIPFSEFYSALENKPENILLLSDWYYKLEYDKFTCCSYCKSNEIDYFLEKDVVFEIANFHWVDFNSLEKLHRLSPYEVAELYYISNQCRPIKSFYFDKIDNKYFYLSHDDGYSSILWFKQIEEFYSMAGKIICEKISLIYDLILEPFSCDISKELSKLSKHGIFFKLEDLNADKDNSILIPIYCADNIEDESKMDGKIRKNIVKPKYYMKYHTVWEIIKI